MAVSTFLFFFPGPLVLGLCTDHKLKLAYMMRSDGVHSIREVGFRSRFIQRKVRKTMRMQNLECG